MTLFLDEDPNLREKQALKFDSGAVGPKPAKLHRQLTAAHYHQLIIGMSTSIDEETRLKALDCGMDHFLPKPFTLQKFIEAIKTSRESKHLNGSSAIIGNTTNPNNLGKN